MKKLLLSLMLVLCAARGFGTEIPEPARDFRGAWIATVFNIDWPSKPGLPTELQKAELRGLLNKAAELKLNAVILQVRPACDALYASKREPWSSFLTGTQGQPPQPLYDPLEFAVAEAHARGLELHAWFNPFRAVASTTAVAAENHVSKIHPEWIRKYGNLVWLDPGEPAARKWSIETILDVTHRYDVDGIHIDDYFYPYPIKAAGGGLTPFPDDAPWSAYQKSGGKLSRDDWRRDNINTFIKDLYARIKAEKRWVKFGVSPFGIWRPHVPETIEAGIDSYAQLFADSRLWVREGWADYFSPQLYWGIAPAKQSFPVLLNWWAGENAGKRHLWPGISTSRVGPQRPAIEMVNQIALTRATLPGDPGHIHWSIKSLRNNTGGVTDLLSAATYGENALVPASPWLGNSVPAAPSVYAEKSQVFVKSENANALSWWAVQEKVGGVWKLRTIPSSSSRIQRSPQAEILAIRAVDRAGNASEAALVQ